VDFFLLGGGKRAFPKITQIYLKTQRGVLFSRSMKRIANFLEGKEAKRLLVVSATWNLEI